MRPPRRGCVQSTSEMLPRSLLLLPAEAKPGSSLQSGQARLRVRPANELHGAVAKSCAALPHFLSPSFGNRGICATLKTVEERDDKSRALFVRNLQSFGR